MNIFKKMIVKLKNIFSKKLFSSSDDIVLYICGSEALPAPLEPSAERALLEEMQKGNQTARDKLVEHNLRLVVYIAKKFENTGTPLEDLISIGAIGLIKAVKTYNYEKNIKLATYASRCIENEILMHLRKTSRQKVEVSLDQPLKFDESGSELNLEDILFDESASVSSRLEEDADRQILLAAIAKLGGREQQIMRLRFGLDGKPELTQKEVADLLGISQSYISRIEKKILAKIRSDLLKAGNF